MSLSDRRFGAELEVFLPFCVSQVPRGPSPAHKVARFLVSKGVPAISTDELRQNPDRQDRASLWLTMEEPSLGTGSWDLEEAAEITTPIMQGERDLSQLEMVTRQLAAHEFMVDPRTGLHVHHDAGDLDVSAFKRLAFNHVIAERAFDRLIAADRRGDRNKHALSTRPEGIVDHFLTRLDGVSHVAGISNALFLGSKTTDRPKLNLDAFTKHGTVEFRHHHGTLDDNQVTHWVRLTQAFVDFSARQPTLLSVSDGVIDPQGAWRESMDDSAAVQDRLLGKLISLAGPKTRQHFMGVLCDREAAVSPLVANANPPPLRHGL